MLDELHDNHPDITSIKSKAKPYAWWSSINTLIEQKVESCNSCQLYQLLPSKALIHP